MAQRWEVLREQTLTQLRGLDLPPSLHFWISPEQVWKETSIELEHLDRQVFDLTTLPKSNWEIFQELSGQLSPDLDMLIREARAYRELDTSEKVRSYLDAEFLGDEDHYHLAGRDGYAGHGTRILFDRLLRISQLPELTPQQRSTALSSLRCWETAVIDIVIDPDVYYLKTKSGTEGTISEHYGCLVACCVHPRYSGNTDSGQYFRSLKQAFRYDEIIAGQIPEDHLDHFRQFIIGCLVYDLQTPDACQTEDYWLKILNTPGFKHCVDPEFDDDEEI